MSNVIKSATNKFTKGLIMDFSPENTSNEVLTHALNATLLTFNGNEMSLQNDMGNGRVETAFLPEGYIPVGTCEYGGIIYIVSYNPLEDKSQIGCFPSPERNISNEELGESTDQTITSDNFQDITPGDLKQTTYTVILRNSELNSGDKFIISANSEIYKEKIQDLKQNISGTFQQIDNPIIKLNIVSIEDSGKIVYLNDTLRSYNKTYNNNDYQYYIVGETQKASSISKIDIDSYRNVLSSGYNVFKSKVSGKLAILAELITIDSYSVTHSIEPIDDSGSYQIKIHTDVTPDLTDDPSIKPKLKYYYLKDSKLYIQKNNENDENYEYFKGDWNKLKLKEFYSPISHEKRILDCGIFNFHKPNTYHGRMILQNYDSLNWDSNNNITLKGKEIIYTKFSKNKLHKFDKSQLCLPDKSWNTYWDGVSVEYYLYDSEGQFIEVKAEDITTIDVNEFFIKSLSDIYVSSKNFIPNKNYNWINGDSDKHAYVEGDNTSEKIDTYFIDIYKIGDYIPDETNDYKYDDVILADIKIPEEVYNSNNKVPMKYDYTIVPCMEYGKLAHLAVSNTIDFSKLMDFNASTFNTWKYRIDEKQLTLTFGAEIYDTGQTNKVDALILEFYDLWGFVGSLEITNKKSYSGIFTKILRIDELGQLNSKKITGNNYTNNYVHNTLITLTYDEEKNKEVLKYNGSNITIDSTTGVSDTSFNDCTMLRSNMIYGVKSYLRQKNSDGNSYIFTKKEDFFLFTSPIYNDYFYKSQNYNNIINPKLNFILTYKLENSGNYKPYEDKIIDENGTSYVNNFTNGYYHHDEISDGVITKNSDYRNFNDYSKGSYSLNNELTLTKFYKYQGETKLYLEIGLREEYNNFNITYDSKINEKFSCTLQLLSEKLINDSDSTQGYRTYQINSARENETDEQLLNYVGFKNYANNDILTMDNNFLKFPVFGTAISEKDGNKKYISDLSKYNFLKNINIENTENTNIENYIPINYEFIIGYNAKIINIKSTQIPSVTVTPLCNNIEEAYNYEDFSIYEVTDGDNKGCYLSDKMYYNGGTANTELFGLCRMTTIKGDTVFSECKDISKQSSSAKDIKAPGRLNINYLSSIVSDIGKLTFCMPHVHYGFDDGNGVNIHLAANRTDLNISRNSKQIRFNRENPITQIRDFEDREKDKVTESDDTYGIAVSNEYANNPKYNMVLNTYKSLEQQSEFISTLDSQTVAGRQRVLDLHKDPWDAWFESGKAIYDGAQDYYTFENSKFTGLTSEQIAVFNQKLLTTMKGVYAYNPNYATIAVNIGDAIIENKQIQIVSYLVSCNASLSKELCLNDYVGIGNISFSKYFELLNKHSNISIKESGKFKGQINFTADLTFCGGVDNYLISQLTYNISLPIEYQKELLFQQDDKILVKHNDGNNSLLNGKINKKTLYGFYHDVNLNKLIELDVSNYHIDKNGELWIKYIDKYKKSGYNKE